MPVCTTYDKCTRYTFPRDIQPLCLDQVREWPNTGPITIESYIQSNISAYGTVSTAIRVYPEFFKFWSSNPKQVWKSTTRKSGTPGGHAVNIVGWGTAGDGTKYWKMKNCCKCCIFDSIFICRYILAISMP